MQLLLAAYLQYSSFFCYLLSAEVFIFMKKTCSKRVLSLFLAALMMVTSIPVFAVTAQAENQTDVYASNDDAVKLLEKMEEFEAKVSGSETVLTNMKNAYDAYVKASQAYDAYVYGENKDVNLSDYYSNLDNAINNMSSWTQFVGTKVPVFSDADDWFGNSRYENYMSSEYGIGYNNVLYAPDVSRTPVITQDYAAARRDLFMSSNPVVLYDGINAPILPVALGGERTDYTKTRYFWFAGPIEIANIKDQNNESLNWEMIGSWYGTTWNGDWQWLFSSGRTGTNGITAQMPGTYNDNSNYKGSSIESFKLWANAVRFKGVPTEIGTTYDINWAIVAGGDGPDDYTYGTTSVRVINYKALTDAVSNAFSTFKSNISEYREGGLSDLFAAIDNATTLDPNSYFANNTDGYDNCVSAITNAINSISSASNPAKDSEGYQAFRDLIDSGLVQDLDNYSTSSVDDYNEILSAGRMLMSNPLNNGYTSGESAVLTQVVDATENVLNPKVDTTALSEEIQSKSELSIFLGDEQIYTLQSWVELNDEIETAKTLISDYSQYGKFTSSEATVSGVTYQRIVDFTTLSNEQQTINTEKNTLSSMSLFPIIEDAIQNFDSASEVASTIPVSAYDGEYRDETVDMVNEYHDQVYVTADEATDTYNCEVPETFTGEVVYDSKDIDDKTTDILEQLGGLEQKYATYTVTINDGEQTETASIVYGESYELPQKDVPGVWKLVLTDKDGNTEGTITQVVPGGKQISVTVESNIDATFKPSVTGSASGEYYTVNVLDKFGNHLAVLYSQQPMSNDEVVSLLDDNSITAKVIPFYTFSKWNISYNESEKTFTVRPEYTFDTNGKYSFSVNGKDIGYYNYDSPVIISDSSIETPYMWVNKTEEGNYQIASYSESFKVFACADGDYYPAYKHDDGNYYVKENGKDIQLTSENVDGIILPKGYTDQTADEHLNFKLDNQYPFIYVDGTKTVDTNQYRVYAKFTEGATKYKAFGVVIVYDGAEYKFNCTNKTSSNQYMFTIKINGTESGDEITFRPYVNHWFKYDEKTIDAFYYDEEILTVD